MILIFDKSSVHAAGSSFVVACTSFRFNPGFEGSNPEPEGRAHDPGPDAHVSQANDRGSKRTWTAHEHSDGLTLGLLWLVDGSPNMLRQ